MENTRPQQSVTSQTPQESKHGACKIPPISLQNFSRATRWALRGALLLAFLILAAKGIYPHLGTTKGDFANYYTAARLVQEGVDLSPAYRDFSWFQRQMDRFGLQEQLGGFIPHPPAAALLFQPLATLPPEQARLVWTGCNLLLLVVIAWSLGRITRMSPQITLFLVMGAGYGLLNNFLFGQVYLLLTASITLALYFEDRNRPWLAGFCLGSLIPIKYFGVIFLSYWIWRGKWRAVSATLISLSIVMGAGILAAGWQPHVVFLSEVLPRHLAGEIQDPYSVTLQTFTSLYRRWFQFENLLNPEPVLESPFLFSLSRSLTNAVLLTTALVVLKQVRFSGRFHQRLFRLGWLPLVALLLSPASASYHFLLLIPAAAFFIRIELDLNQRGQAILLAGSFALINLPHFVYLRDMTPPGWAGILVYSRLGALVGFGLLTYFLLVRPRLTPPPNWSGWGFVFAGLFLFGLGGPLLSENRQNDRARPLAIPGELYARNFGLISQHPSVRKASGGDRWQIVFSFAELLENRYILLAQDGSAVLSERHRNFYQPSISSSGDELLTLSILKGKEQILSYSAAAGNPPQVLTTGSYPTWHPSGRQFAYQEAGSIFLADLSGGTERLAGDSAFHPAFSSDGQSLFFVHREEAGSSLMRLGLQTGKLEKLRSFSR